MMLEGLILLLSTLVHSVILIHFIMRQEVSATSFFFYISFIVNYFGFLCVLLINLTGGNYKISILDLIEKLALPYLIFTLSCSSALILVKILKIKFVFIHPQSVPSINFYFISFFIIALIGFTFYISANGLVLLNLQSYGDRNIALTGSGVSRIFISFGLINFFILLALNVNKYQIRHLFYAIVVGGLVFIVSGGARVGAIRPALLYSLVVWRKKKSVILRLGLVFLFVFVFALIGLLLRYKSGFILEIVLNQIQGSFSPIDSTYLVIASGVTHQFDLLLNHFQTLVPRFLWNEKPLFIPTPSNYFTSEILRYSSNVTISVSLIGELMLVGGYLGLILGPFIIIVLLTTLDRSLESNSLNAKLFFWSNILISFPLMREGLGLFLRNIMFNYFLYFFFFVFLYLVWMLLRQVK